MLKKEEFDEIIKRNLVDKVGKDKFVYKTSDNKPHEVYYENSVFEAFKQEMEDIHFIKYKEGKGGELDEKKGRYGLVPPKMASVASSSRFCYLALRNGGSAIGGNDNVEFEVDCHIKGVAGTSPQLDAYFPDNNIFVEAKCHEIFDRHKPVLKKAYWNLIYGENSQFGFKAKGKISETEFEIPLTEFRFESGKRSTMFDIKQFLCHLMGIASKMNDETQSKKESTLVYLFFKPKTDDIEINNKIDKVFRDLKTEIDLIFGCKPIKTFAEKNNIKLVAVAECDYVMKELTGENIKDFKMW